MGPLDVLGDRGVRKTLLFVRRSALPVTAGDVAAALKSPRSVARWRLERLVRAGLLEPEFERRDAGRPAKIYAPAAETSAIEFPPRRYETLIASLASSVPRGRLADVGKSYARELADAMRLRPARSLPAALERVCRGLGRLGFHVVVDDVSDDRATLVSATCPLRPLVREHPNIAAIDEGMWSGLIAAARGRGLATVACSTHHCLEDGTSCRILVQVKSVR
jgi:predicted ArsR family transcriptional regulator